MPLANSAGVSGSLGSHDQPLALRPHSYSSSYPTPYLGLRARLSQIWINRWTVLLFLVLVRVLMSIGSIDDSLGDAREKALSACLKVESAGSALASMPFYMSKGLNELTATGVEKAVNGLMSMLDLTITGIQEIVVFYINMLTGTYVCLITLAVNGAISALTKLVEEVTDFINKAIPDIAGGIGDVVGKFQDAMNGFAGALNSLPFGSSVPTIDLNDEMKKLDDIPNQIPLGFLDDVKKLNESVPDFKEVQNFTDNIIRTPFQEIKKLIKNEMDTYTFDRSLFPVPQKQQLDFCSEGNGLNDFFDGLVELLYKGKKIFIGVIVVLAILVCVPMAYLEKKRFDREEANVRNFEKCVGSHDIDPRDLVYTTSRPHTAGFALWATSRKKSPDCSNSVHRVEPSKRSVLFRWVVAYATSPPALFVLSLAIAGIFSCICQYIMLRAIETQVPDLTDQVADFTEKITLALTNASESWQNGTNLAIKTANDDINDKVFGWVETSTNAVNDTLAGFVDKMTEGIDKVFGGTFLKDPIQGVINCLIVYKIEGIQKGLTWVHDNAHVSFPMVANDTFTLAALADKTDSKSDDEFLLAPGDKTKDELTELVDKLINKVEKGILQEAAVSAAVLGVWLLLGIIGIVWACFQLAGHKDAPSNLDKWNQDRGEAPDANHVNDTLEKYATSSSESNGYSEGPPPQYGTEHPGEVKSGQANYVYPDNRQSHYPDNRDSHYPDDDLHVHPQPAQDNPFDEKADYDDYMGYNANKYDSKN